MRNLGWALCLAILFGTSPLMAQGDAAAARTAAGCGPLGVQYDVKTDESQHTVAPVPADKAVIYVFEDEFNGLTMRIGADGAWVGATHSRSYLFFTVTPGEHRVCMEWQTSLNKKTAPVGAALAFATEAGKAYYLRVTFREMGRTLPLANMELANEAEGKFLIAASALSSSQVKK